MPKQIKKTSLKLPIILLTMSFLVIIPTTSIILIGGSILKNDKGYQDCLYDLRNSNSNDRIKVWGSKFYYCEVPESYTRLPFYHDRNKIDFSFMGLLDTLLKIVIIPMTTIILFFSGMIILVARLKIRKLSKNKV